MSLKAVFLPKRTAGREPVNPEGETRRANGMYELLEDGKAPQSNVTTRLLRGGTTPTYGQS